MQIRATSGRPVGLTLLAAGSVVVGVTLLALAAFELYVHHQIPAALFETFRGFPEGFVLVAGLVMVLELVTAYGLWTLRWWGRLLAYAFALIGIGAGMLTLPFGIASVLLNLLTTWYLTDPRIRRLFRPSRARPAAD